MKKVRISKEAGTAKEPKDRKDRNSWNNKVFVIPMLGNRNISPIKELLDAAWEAGIC
jgi:hypothetical protein